MPQSTRVAVVSGVTLLVVTLLLSASALQAATDWNKATTENFVLYTTANDRQARRTLKLFEQLRGFFLDIFQPDQLPTEKTVIIGFRNRREFRPYQLNDFVDAYYLGGHDRDYIVIGDLGPDNQPIAIHEYVHLLAKHSDLNLPVWLNEGMAELYSTLQSQGDQVIVGNLIPGRVEVLRKHRWLPIETLLDVDQESEHYNERDRASVFYSQSWALAHMLNLSPEFQPLFGDLVAALVGGVEPVQAFETVYGMSPDALEKKLRRYLKQYSFLGVRFDVKLEKTALEPTVEPASDLEAGLVLAKLLEGSRDSERRQQAREHYLALEAKHPENAEIQEGLAKLALRDNQQTKARQHFERAVELGSENPEVYLRSAALLDDTELDLRIALLIEAVKLRPLDTSTRRYLASELARDERWLQALVHLHSIKKVESREDAFDLYRQRAFLCLRVERFEDAQKALDQAQASADTAQQLDQLRDMQSYLAQRQAYVDRGEQFPPADAQLTSYPGGPPRMVRGDGRERPIAPNTPVEAPPLSFAGALTLFDCQGPTPVLTLEGETTAKFVIDDPTAIVVLSKQGGELSFSCGSQPGRNLRVEYQLDPDGDSSVLGVITLIEAY